MHDHHHPGRRAWLIRLALLAAGSHASIARAQPMPEFAKILVGFPGGSSPDIVARRLAESLKGRLAATVLVENKPGAGGSLAVLSALQAPVDGLTLLLNPAGVVTVNPHTYRRLRYRPFDDLKPLGLACNVEFGFAVGSAVPASVKTLEDFATWAKQHPGRVFYASPAAGAAPHFVGFMLDRKLGTGMQHVPYRGGGPAVADVIGGQVAGVCLVLADLLPNARSGKLRILATSGRTRSAFAPDVPTFLEQGVPELELRDWYGVYVAGQTGAETIERVANLVRNATSAPEYRQGLAAIGLEAASSTPRELEQLARADFARWAPVVKASGFVADE